MKLMVMSSYLLDLVRSFEPVPDIPSGQQNRDRSIGLKKVVDDWINPDTRSSIESIYGPIADWDTSGVTSMDGLLFFQQTINVNISEWDVSNVETMSSSMFQLFSFFDDRLLLESQNLSTFSSFVSSSLSPSSHFSYLLLSFSLF